MSTEAAATLSLEISTGGAEVKLRELATAYATLKAELSGSVSASGISSATNAELIAVRKELAATKASYVALNDTVEGFKKKMNTPIQGGGTGMFTGLNKDIERSSSNLKIMLTSAEMTGNAAIKAADSLRKMNDSGFNSSKLAENLGIQKQTTEQMVAQAALRELNVSGTQAAERAKVAIAEKQVTEQMVAQAALREMNVSGTRAVELAKVVAEEKQVTAQYVAQAALRELNVSGTRAAERAKVALAEKQVTEQMVAQAALRELNVSGTRAAELAKIVAAERQVTKELEAQARWVALTEKQRAQATVQASKAVYGGAQQSLLPGVAGSSQALAAAQSAGSTAAAQSALDALTASHSKAIPSVTAHTAATKKFGEAANEAHAFARGLSGSLGTLWMTYGSMVPLMAGAALAGGFMQAAKAGSEFAYQLTFVKALGGESADSVAQIGTAALNLSKTSMYGPVELANGLRILSQAGLDAKASMQALPSAMQLATVGEMSMEQASITLVGVMNAFGESLGALPHIGDMFAKAAAMSQTSVSGMADAMKTASVVHDQYGASIEDTATAITLLAKVNITGTAAGTSYRNMLKDIYTPSKQAAAVIKQLGLETKDSMGNLREAPEIMFDLQKILKSYTQGSQTDILGKIFSERGGKEAIQILNQTRESWEKTKASISNSDGFMSNVTSELEMTTKGRFKQALNTMQSNLIGAFDASEGSVRGLADALRNLADSPEFIAGINTIVGGMASLATTVVNLLPLLLDLGAAWAVFKGVGMLVGGLSAASAALGTLSTAATIFAAESAVAGGGLAGLEAGLVAMTGSAAAAAGVGGLGALSATLLALPLTAAVAGLGYLSYKLYEVENSTPAAVKQLNSFNDVLDRELVKLKATNSELEKRFSLLNGGNDSDQAMTEAQARRAAAVGARDAAQAKIPKVLVDENLPIEGYSSEISAQQQAVAKANAAIAREDKLLGELSVEQARSNSLSLVNTLKETSQQVEKLKADAAHSKKKLDTSQIESFMEGAYNNSGMSPENLRKMREQLGRMTSDLQKDLNGGGNKKFVATDPKAGRTAARAAAREADRDIKDERKIAADNLSSALKKEQIDLSTKLVAIDIDVAAQTISSTVAQEKKNDATQASLLLERMQIEASLEKAKVALKNAAPGKAHEDKVLVAKFENDLIENEARSKKQSEQSTLDLTKARTADRNAIENSSLSTARYLEDLSLERDNIGKTALEVANLRIEREKERAVGDINVKLNRKTIEPEVAAAEKANLETRANAQKSEAAYQDSFVGGWNKAFDEYSRSANNAANSAREVFTSMSSAMSDAIVQFTTTGKVNFASLGTSMLQTAAKVMADKATASMMGGLTGLVSKFFGGSTTPSGTIIGGGQYSAYSDMVTPMASANGNVFSGSDSLHQYVNTVQTSPKTFAFDTLHGFAKGGVFAEAGPEAVMPLSRDSNGRLGVKSQGSQGSTVQIGITINADGTGAKQDTKGDTSGAWTEFAARMKAMILEQMINEKRPGGLLYN